MSLLSDEKGGVEKFDSPPSVLNRSQCIKNGLYLVTIPTRVYFLQSEPAIGILKKIRNGIGTGLCGRAGTRNGILIPRVKWIGIGIPGRFLTQSSKHLQRSIYTRALKKNLDRHFLCSGFNEGDAVRIGFIHLFFWIYLLELHTPLFPHTQRN